MRHDIQYALRGFRRNPAFTFTAVSVLAIGIGANTAVFSVVDTMLLKPLALPHPERVVQLMRRNQRFNLYCVGVADLMVWRAQTQILEDVAGYSYVPDKVSLTGGGAPEQVAAEHVSREFFRLFDARTAVGRLFAAAEDRPGAGNFAVISHRLWERRFGSDRNIAGKAMLLGGDAYTVVGVMSAGFQGDRAVELWLPLQADAASAAGCSLWGAARLKPGVSLGQAKAALQIAAAEYKRRYPVKTTFLGEAAMPDEVTYTAEPMETIVTSDIRPAILVLLGAVGCVLLIACANVANLLLVRAGGRTREIAIRSAVGGSRGRIMRQLLTESVILSLAGGALGVILGALAVRAVPALEPISIARIGPSARQVTLDSGVLLVTSLLAVLTGLLFGLAPALQASRVDLSRRLQQSGASARGGRNRLRGWLVTAEMALSVMLLAGAGMMIRSFVALRSEPTGFDAHNVVTLETALAGSAFDRVDAVSALARRIEERLRAIPGVEAVAAADSVPLLPNLSRGFVIDGRTAGSTWRAVTPGYFAVFRIPLTAGRAFRAGDDAHAPPVVLINQAMARRYWRNQNAVGREISFLGSGGIAERAAEIVGVVSDARETGLAGPMQPVIYVPLAQVDDRFFASMRVWLQSLSWSIRTRGAPGPVLPAIQQEIRTAADLPAGNIRPMEQIVTSSTAHEASQTALLAAFALVAILLAAVGLHGVLAYAVEQRRAEFGIRLALGAGPADLRRMILGQGLRHAGAGIVIGSGGALAFTRLASALLIGVKAADPLVFLATPVLLTAVALGTSYSASRRIRAIDPVDALRYS